MEVKSKQFLQNKMGTTNFQKIFQECNWDIHKICSYMVKKANKVASEYPQDKNKKVEVFNEFQKQIEAMLLNYKQSENNKIVEQVICKIVLNNLKFHIDAAKHSYCYQIIPIVLVSFETLQQDVQQNIIQQLDAIQKKKINQKTNYLQKIRYQAALLNMAYLNLQLQKFEQSLIYLDQLEIYCKSKQYDENSKDNILKQSQRNAIKKSVDQNKKKLKFEKKQQLRYGFLESLYSYKALIFVYLNKLKLLNTQIDSLKMIFDKVKYHTKYEKLQKRLKLHIKIFKIYQHFSLRQFDKSKNILKSFKDQDLEEALLIFFNNPNYSCLRNIETIFYSLFSENFFEIFTKLQKYQLQKLEKQQIDELKQIYNNSIKKNEEYIFGKCKILISLIISSQLLRIDKEYSDAKKQIYIVFEMNRLTNTQLSESMEAFLKYNLLIIHLEEKIKNYKCKYETTEVITTLSNKIWNCKQINQNNQIENREQMLIAKFPEEKVQQMLIFNEIAIQKLIEHRNFMNIYDIYLNDKNQIVSVYKKQGDNLQNHLKNKQIKQETRFKYTQQILNFFKYIHSLNIFVYGFTLENIITVLGSEDLIKISFRNAFIKLFDKYIKPTNFNQMNDPSEYKEFATFESQIFEIGKVMYTLLIVLNKDDQMENIQVSDQLKNKFLISKQLRNLIYSMLNQEIQKRPSLLEVTSQFKFEYFTFKIFMYITKDKSYDNFEAKQTQYQTFIDKLIKDFQNFKSKFSKTHYFLPTSQEGGSLKKQEFEKYFNQQTIKDAIYELIVVQQDRNFIDCLMNENDIENFSKEFLDNSEKELIVKNIIELQNKYAQEDKDSKKDILPEFSKDIIDKEYKTDKFESIQTEKISENDKTNTQEFLTNQLKVILKKIYKEALDSIGEKLNEQQTKQNSEQQQKEERYNNIQTNQDSMKAISIKNGDSQNNNLTSSNAIGSDLYQNSNSKIYNNIVQENQIQTNINREINIDIDGVDRQTDEYIGQYTNILEGAIIGTISQDSQSD